MKPKALPGIRHATRTGRLNLYQLFVVGVALMAALVSISTAAFAISERESERYDWKGTWESSYKKETTGPDFPWAFTRIEDRFQASFSFSVDAGGNVRGEGFASVYYHFEYDGCASVTQGACSVRCNGAGTKKGGFEVSLAEYSVYLPVEIPVTGKVSGTSVHLKLGPPADPMPFDISSSCVGPEGLQFFTSEMNWFCPPGSYVCAASAMFLEIDLPLVHGAAQRLPTGDGGLTGMVRIRRTCRNIRDGDSGFVYVRALTSPLHKEPSANSPIVSGEPRAARLVFRDTVQKNGLRWYYITPPAGDSGWVPASEISCERPPPLPPGKPLYLRDTGLGNEHPTGSMTTGGAG